LNAAELILADLRSRGARLWLVGDRVRVEAQRGTLTSDLVGQVRAHRAELVELLRREADSRPIIEISGPGVGAWLADLDRRWRVAVARARRGFASAGADPTSERLQAAAKLELDLADCGPERDLSESLRGLYAGRLDARLLESGRVHVWVPDGPAS
jgi:hypothetical protein